MANGDDYRTDVTGSIKDRYLERERRLAGLQKPLAREVALRGAPMDTAEQLESILNEQGKVVTPAVAQKKGQSWHDRGVFGFFKKHLAEPVGYVFTQVIPAWAELVTYALEHGTLRKWIGDENWEEWQAERLEEGMSWNEEVKQYGIGEALNRGIRRLAGARKKRPGLFWGEKVLAEIVCDPTTYMGWGLMSKIPVAGKVLGPIMDTMPQQIWKQSFGRGAKFFRTSTGWEHITADYVTPLTLFAKSRETVIARHELLARAAFVDTVGGAAMLSNDVTKMESVCDILVKLREAGGEIPYEVLKIAEASGGQNRITQRTMDQLKLVAATLDEYAARMADETGEFVDNWIDELRKMAPQDAVDHIGKMMREATNYEYTKAMEQWHHSRHLAQRVLANVIEPPMDWMQNRFTRWAILEPARAMLLFMNYGPFNVMEDFVRAIGGGSRPSLVNASTFDTMMAQIGGVPLELRGAIEGSEYGLQLRALGAQRVDKAPILAHLNLPGLKQIAKLQARWNNYLAEGGACIRRGHFVTKMMESARSGAIKMGYANTEEYARVRALVRMFPKGINSRVLNKDARKCIEVAAEMGNGDIIRNLPADVFSRPRIAQARVEEIVEHTLPGLSYPDRLWLTEEFRAGRVKNLRMLRGRMKQRAAEHIRLNTDALYEATGHRLTQFKTRFMADDLTVDEAIRLLDEFGIQAENWRHLPSDVHSGLISISPAGFKGRAGAVTEMEWYGRIEGTRAMVTQRLNEMADLMEESRKALAANKMMKQAVKERFEGHYDAFRTNLRNLRQDMEEYHFRLNQIKEEFFPAGKGIGTGWMTYKEDFKRISRGDFSQIDRLPAKLREVITGKPLTEDKGFWQATRLDAKSPHRKVTMNELKNAFYEAQKEAVNEATVGHVNKTGGVLRRTPQRRVYEDGYFSKHLKDWFKEAEITQKLHRNPSLLDTVTWDAAVPDKLRKRIATALDRLPFDISSNVKEVVIDRAACEAMGADALFYHSGKVAFRTEKQIRPDVIIHEWFHSHVKTGITEDMRRAMVREFLNGYHPQRLPDYVPVQYHLTQDDMVKLRNYAAGAASEYQSWNKVDETLSYIFMEYSSDPDAVTEPFGALFRRFLPAKETPEQVIFRTLDEAAEGLQKQMGTAARNRQAAKMMQTTSHWSNLEHQVDTCFDELTKAAATDYIPKAEMDAFTAYCNRTADAVDQMMGSKAINADLCENVRKAADDAVNAVKDDFANYGDTMLLDSAMKMINPFWIYQSRSWPWLAGQAFRHPGMFQTLRPHGRYWELTEEGYIPTPLWGMQFSPLRGTVFNRLRRAFRGPYPQRYQGLMGSLDNAINKYMEKFGFYPGLHLTVPLEMMTGLMSSGTRKDMMSAIVESMPALPATAVEGLIAMSDFGPSNFTITLADTLFPSKFREYYMAKALWDAHKVSVSKAKELGHDDWIAEAYRDVSMRSMIENQLSMSRFNPESWQKIEEQKRTMIQELTGLTVEEQIRIKREGGRVSDHVALSRIDRAKLREIEGYDALTEGTRPLSEGLRQEYIETLSDKYDMLEDVRQGLLLDQAGDDWRLQNAWITADDWRTNYYERWQEYRSTIDNLIYSDYYAKLGRTVEEQKAIREKLQFSTGLVHPVDVIIDAMFAMEPEQDMFGNVDWISLFDAQEALLQTLDEETQAEVRAYLSRNATPLMKKFREGREFMQQYWRADKSLVAWYEKIGRPELAREIEFLFPLVRMHELEMQEALNMGLEYDIAKMNQYAGHINRLNRHISEIRWRMAYDPEFYVSEDVKYDPRIADFLITFYGRPPKESMR